MIFKFDSFPVRRPVLSEMNDGRPSRWMAERHCVPVFIRGEDNITSENS